MHVIVRMTVCIVMITVFVMMTRTLMLVNLLGLAPMMLSHTLPPLFSCRQLYVVKDGRKRNSRLQMQHIARISRSHQPILQNRFKVILRSTGVTLTHFTKSFLRITIT